MYFITLLNFIQKCLMLKAFYRRRAWILNEKKQKTKRCCGCSSLTSYRDYDNSEVQKTIIFLNQLCTFQFCFKLVSDVRGHCKNKRFDNERELSSFFYWISISVPASCQNNQRELLLWKDCTFLFTLFSRSASALRLSWAFAALLQSNRNKKKTRRREQKLQKSLLVLLCCCCMCLDWSFLTSSFGAHSRHQ